MLTLFGTYYVAAKASGLTPAARLSFADAAGPMSGLVLACVECTWQHRSALNGAQTWRCHVSPH